MHYFLSAYRNLADYKITNLFTLDVTAKHPPAVLSDCDMPNEVNSVPMCPQG